MKGRGLQRKGFAIRVGYEISGSMTRESGCVVSHRGDVPVGVDMTQREERKGLGSVRMETPNRTGGSKDEPMTILEPMTSTDW